MPLVRVDIPTGRSDEVKSRLKEAIKAAIIEALDPKITKYVYVGIREVFAELGDGVPSATVDLRPGREVERKAALARGISAALSEALGSKPEDLYLLFRETPAADHYCGGEPLPEWRP